ncbi:MAG: DUF1801 domain-containing protein [bacterium]
MARRADRRKLGTQGAVTPAGILADHTPAVRTLATRLRRLIRKTIPDAREVAYPLWHGIGYRHPRAGYFCGIFPQKSSVRLGFEYGAHLPDPDGLLEIGGAQVRYMIVRTGKDIRIPPLKKLLLAAIHHREH